MEVFIDFLVNNYMWFLVITIFLIFSLIGYIVESREQKVLNVYGGSQQEMEKNFEQLAFAAQNKTLGDVVVNNPMNSNTIPNNNQIIPNNSVNNNLNMNVNTSSSMNRSQAPVDMAMPLPKEKSAPSFEVLGK